MQPIAKSARIFTITNAHSMTYSFPIDTERLLNVLNSNITARGTETAAYSIACDDLKAGIYSELTSINVRDCGRKANKAVQDDLFFQSMEYQKAQRDNA